jgi:hypothetical protein
LSWGIIFPAHLVRGLGGYRIGHAAVVGREDLLLKLDQMAGPRGYLAKIERKSRVVESHASRSRLRRESRVFSRNSVWTADGWRPVGTASNQLAQV